MIDSVTTTKVAKDTSTTTGTTQATDTTTDSTSVPAEFDSIMRSMLTADSSGQVSEEDLFAANVGEKISTLKGSDTLDKYKTALTAERAKVTGSDGFIQQEAAGINALKSLVADGTLTSDEGDQIYTQAFKSSQLDSDTTSLFDSKGGVNDPTTAMALLSDAIKKASDATASVTDLSTASLMSLSTASPTGSASTASGIATLSAVDGSAATGDAGGTTDVTPKGTVVDGAKGFLFKPVTNNEGSLAIMAPASWTGNISAVVIKDSLGNVLENGQQKLAGVSETGQEKWTFSKQGGNYPKNISVEFTMSNGATKTYHIADPSKRYD